MTPERIAELRRLNFSISRSVGHVDLWEIDGFEALSEMHKGLREALDAIERVRKLHTPFRIYDECGHKHDGEEPGVVDVNDVGLVCEAGYMYSICRECCTDDEAMLEQCADAHRHGKDKPICATSAALELTL